MPTTPKMPLTKSQTNNEKSNKQIAFNYLSKRQTAERVKRRKVWRAAGRTAHKFAEARICRHKSLMYCARQLKDLYTLEKYSPCEDTHTLIIIIYTYFLVRYTQTFIRYTIYGIIRYPRMRYTLAKYMQDTLT